MNELVRYDAMCRAIDKAYDVDEVKDIRDKAMAIETYARQARNIDNERKACDIRLRAERKYGELRRKEEKSAGGRPSKNIPPPVGRVSTNDERREQLGISKRQDEQWQALAAIPREQFEAALAAPVKPTTSGILRCAQEPKRAPIDPKALWFWGHLRDLERDGVLSAAPQTILAEMTDAMRADTLRLVPIVCKWLEDFL